jgi:hypothetical protein
MVDNLIVMDRFEYRLTNEVKIPEAHTKYLREVITKLKDTPAPLSEQVHMIKELLSLGWIQGLYGNCKGMCLFGAADQLRIIYSLKYEVFEDLRKELLPITITGWIEETIQVMTKMDIVSFNDHQCQSFSNVADMLDKLEQIALCQERFRAEMHNE